MSSIDLSKLPAPEVVETLDFEAILASMKAHFATLSPELASKLDFESEPATKLFEVCAYRELVLRNRINEAAKSVMLPYASGTDLDNLGALVAVERLANEDDENYRNRILLSYAQYSTAGSRDSYVYHAMSASDSISDVAVYSDDPGMVDIVVLPKLGAESPDLVEQVELAVNAETVRPLCDSVRVLPANMIDLPITAKLYISNGPDPSLVEQSIMSKLYAFSAGLKIGETVHLSKLYAVLHQPGVLSVDLNMTGDLIVGRGQAARISQINLSFEVVDGG